MSLFNGLVGTNDLAPYLSGCLQQAATQYIPTMAQEAGAARQRQNVYSPTWLMSGYANASQAKQDYDTVLGRLVPQGWRDWFDCGDELV